MCDYGTHSLKLTNAYNLKEGGSNTRWRSDRTVLSMCRWCTKRLNLNGEISSGGAYSRSNHYRRLAEQSQPILKFRARPRGRCGTDIVDRIHRGAICRHSGKEKTEVADSKFSGLDFDFLCANPRTLCSIVMIASRGRSVDKPSKTLGSDPPDWLLRIKRKRAPPKIRKAYCRGRKY